jgi:hypothetical protein
MIQVAVADQVSLYFVFDRRQIRRVGYPVVNARQVYAQVAAAVHYDRVVFILDEYHVFGAAAVHAAKADDFQARTVVNVVGTLLFVGFSTAVFVRRNILAGNFVRVISASFLGAYCRASAGRFFAGWLFFGVIFWVIWFHW